MGAFVFPQNSRLSNSVSFFFFNLTGETALHNAFHPKTFSRELASLLLDHGADVNMREKLNGNTAVHVAARLCASTTNNKSTQKDMLEVLRSLCKKADVSITNARRETPMHRLATGNVDWTEPLQVLIESGYELNAQNDRGETSLICAVDKGHCNMAELLVDRGACINIKDRHFQTALHHSVQKNQQRLVKLLLVEGQCEVNAADLNGDTALHIAASKGLVEMARILLSTPGVDVNVQNVRGSTPLLSAVESGFTRVVELLLDAYLEADSEKGLLMALDLAEEEFVRKWHPEIFFLLQEALEQRRDLWDEGETSL